MPEIPPEIQRERVVIQLSDIWLPHLSGRWEKESALQSLAMAYVMYAMYYFENFRDFSLAKYLVKRVIPRTTSFRISNSIGLTHRIYLISFNPSSEHVSAGSSSYHTSTYRWR